MFAGIREKLAGQPWLAGGLAGVVIVIAGIYVFRTGASALSDKPYLLNTYYTTDDGATYFAGEGKDVFAMGLRTPPAYRASVFSCGGTEFVGYLTRMPPDQIQAMNAAQQKAEREQQALSSNDPHYGEKFQRIQGELQRVTDAAQKAIEIKRPGASNHWVRLLDPEGQQLQTVKCPKDPSQVPQPVLP
ncbi:MAG: hypothetical protein ACTHM6_17110 [Tepidisphaeraceae bacterium]